MGTKSRWARWVGRTVTGPPLPLIFDVHWPPLSPCGTRSHHICAWKGRGPSAAQSSGELGVVWILSLLRLLPLHPQLPVPLGSPRGSGGAGGLFRCSCCALSSQPSLCACPRGRVSPGSAHLPLLAGSQEQDSAPWSPSRVGSAVLGPQACGFLRFLLFLHFVSLLDLLHESVFLTHPTPPPTAASRGRCLMGLA